MRARPGWFFSRIEKGWHLQALMLLLIFYIAALAIKDSLPTQIRWIFLPSSLRHLTLVSLFLIVISLLLLLVPHRFWFRSESVRPISDKDLSGPVRKQWLAAFYLGYIDDDMQRRIKNNSIGTDARNYVKAVQRQGRNLTRLEAIWLDDGLLDGAFTKKRTAKDVK